MIALPIMLLEPAKQAGIKTPENPDDFSAEEFQYFALFIYAQLGTPMPTPTSHWDNAKIIASLKKKEIKTITFEQLEEKGFQIGFSNY